MFARRWVLANSLESARIFERVFFFFLCFVDRASWYIRTIRTNSQSTQTHDIYKLLYTEYYKYNVSVDNTTLYFIYNKNSILSGRHVSTFIRSSSGPPGKQIQELSIFQYIVGSQMLTDPTMHWNAYDLIKVETCRPDNILFLLCIK